VNTHEIAAEYRLAHWSEIMRERTASGQSIKDFCAAAGFSENTFFYWQRKLREAACQNILTKQIAAAQRTELLAPGESINNLTSESPVSVAWTALCEPAKARADKFSSLSIEIGSSRVLVNADTDAELLAKVCRVLAAL